MSSDSFNFKLPFFSFGFTKTDSIIKLKEGETILLRYWSWRRFGYIRKEYTKIDGRTKVRKL